MLSSFNKTQSDFNSFTEQLSDEWESPKPAGIRILKSLGIEVEKEFVSSSFWKVHYDVWVITNSSDFIKIDNVGIPTTIHGPIHFIFLDKEPAIKAYLDLSKKWKLTDEVGNETISGYSYDERQLSVYKCQFFKLDDIQLNVFANKLLARLGVKKDSDEFKGIENTGTLLESELKANIEDAYNFLKGMGVNINIQGNGTWFDVGLAHCIVTIKKENNLDFFEANPECYDKKDTGVHYFYFTSLEKATKAVYNWAKKFNVDGIKVEHAWGPRSIITKHGNTIGYLHQQANAIMNYEGIIWLAKELSSEMENDEIDGVTATGQLFEHEEHVKRALAIINSFGIQVENYVGADNKTWWITNYSFWKTYKVRNFEFNLENTNGYLIGNLNNTILYLNKQDALEDFERFQKTIEDSKIEEDPTSPHELNIVGKDDSDNDIMWATLYNIDSQRLDTDSLIWFANKLTQDVQPEDKEGLVSIGTILESESWRDDLNFLIGLGLTFVKIEKPIPPLNYVAIAHGVRSISAKESRFCQMLKEAVDEVKASYFDSDSNENSLVYWFNSDESFDKVKNFLHQKYRGKIISDGLGGERLVRGEQDKPGIPTWFTFSRSKEVSMQTKDIEILAKRIKERLGIEPGSDEDSGINVKNSLFEESFPTFLEFSQEDLQTYK